MSLIWKLWWLAADQQRHGHSEGKDLYDAVLLAELDGIRISPRLRQYLRSRLAGTPDPAGLRPEAVRQWAVNWSDLDPRTAREHTHHWLDRLASALTRLGNDHPR